MEAGDTVMDEAEEPVLHAYVAAPLAVSVELPPVQMLEEVAEMETLGDTLTVIVCVLSKTQGAEPTV